MSDDQQKQTEDQEAPEEEVAEATEVGEIAPAPKADVDPDHLDDYGNEIEEIEVYQDEIHNEIKRGDEVDLTQKDPTMRSVTVGIGWDLKAFESDPLDLDASVFLLDKNDKTRIDEDFIFYNSRGSAEGEVKHHGDSRTGAGEGDDETISIDLNALPFDVTRISFVVSIYDLDFDQNHDFSMVKNVYFRIVNPETGHELIRYVLDEDLGENTGLIIGMLDRVGSNWMFQALGESVEGGLGQIASNYGIVVLQDLQLK